MITESYKAAADLSSKQFYWVTLTAEDTVNVCSAVTDVPLGVLQNAPESGEMAQVMIYGKTAVASDEALAIRSIIGTSADGQAAVLSGTNAQRYACGVVVSASTTVGGYARAFIHPPVRDAGPESWAQVSVSDTTYTMLREGITVLADSTSNAVAITLRPAATAGAGAQVSVKDLSGTTETNAISLDGDGAELIDGSATFTLTANREAVTVESTGTAWIVI